MKKADRSLIKMRTYIDDVYEELEITTLDEVEEMDKIDLEAYYEDYRAYEQDLTDLIKEGK